MEQSSVAPLGLSEAAEMARCSRDTIRRAAQKGELKAEMGPGIRGPQWWILESDLLDWLELRDSSSEDQLGSAAQYVDAGLSAAPQHAQQSTYAKAARSSARFAELAQQASPPAEVYIALIDRLSRAERRSVELELQLQQSQRLLTENAESITEKEALAKQAKAQLQAVEDGRLQEIERLASELSAAQEREAQVKASEVRLKAAEEASKAEAARLAAELDATRQQLVEAQKPSGGLLSWLGLRKKRTAGARVDQAV